MMGTWNNSINISGISHSQTLGTVYIFITVFRILKFLKSKIYTILENNIKILLIILTSGPKKKQQRKKKQCCGPLSSMKIKSSQLKTFFPEPVV